MIQFISELLLKIFDLRLREPFGIEAVFRPDQIMVRDIRHHGETADEFVPIEAVGEWACVIDIVQNDRGNDVVRSVLRFVPLGALCRALKREIDIQ